MDNTWVFSRTSGLKKLEIMRCRFLRSIGENVSNQWITDATDKPLLPGGISTAISVCWSFSDHRGSQVKKEVASRLPLEGGKWRISWRLLLVSCRCSPYLKARNNVHMIQVHLGQWPGTTISVLMQSAGKIEMKRKGAICDAPVLLERRICHGPT